MSTENVTNYYMGSFIGSLIGGILILLLDFAGWDESNYYAGFYAEGWIATDSVGGFLILVPIGIGMLYVAYNSYQGTKEALPTEKLELIYKISFAALIAISVGALIFVITISTEDVDWWFGEGFYGGFIGSLISTLLLRNAKNAEFPMK
ncbi:MAG: hypothetical protein ACW99A_05180 [Candidatus Kariarchaeaceae archaeon]|jgi:O-antigen/teichoic acid export membrane protein